jgi:hypothetical protein
VTTSRRCGCSGPIHTLGAALFVLALTLPARADRIAILPLEVGGQPAPQIAADKLAADLMAHGHRVIASADVLARISVGNQGAGLDWAAQVQESIDAARAALTRLDRALALAMARRIGEDLAHRGGGAGGATVLVSWCLLERQLALTASDPKGAAQWLDKAVAVDAGAELDPLRYPAGDRDSFARRRAALHAAPTAALSMETTPAGAEIWVDGVRRCESPCAVTLIAGRHFVRVSSAAHAPAVFDLELSPGTRTARRAGLSAAYSGASPPAISAMLSDPSRRAEGASALEPLARFLDVERMVALLPEQGNVRVLLAPTPNGRPKLGRAVALDELSPAVEADLVPIAPPEQESKPWYVRPGTFIAGAVVVAGVVGGILIYGATRPAKTATVTVMSSP